MSNSPDPSPIESADDANEQRRASLLLKLVAGLGVVVAASGLAAVVWGDRVINTQVLPWVETEVAKAIGRPVEIGNVQGLSFWGIRLGKSTIPPTETDATFLAAEEVGVRVDLGALIFQRKIKPDIVILSPEVNLIKSEDGQWIEFELPEPIEREPRLKTEVQSITVRDARVKASYAVQDEADIVVRGPFEVAEVDVVATFEGEDSQRAIFEVAGNIDSGTFDIDGEANLATQVMNTHVRLQDVPVAGANVLLPALVGLNSGLLNTNLTATAALTEEFQLDLDALEVQGTAQLREGEVLISELAVPVRNIQSRLRFQGQRVTLEETGLQIEDVTLAAQGQVDLEAGYDLTARIPAVSIADLQAIADIELPVAANGTFQLDAQVQGEVMEPRVRGRLTNQGPVRIDQLDLATVAATFALTRSEFDLAELRVVPEAGGLVLAQGQAELQDVTDPTFELAAQVDVPVDAYAELYGVSLPEPTVLGNFTADLQAAGDLTAQTATGQWQLADSSFPGQGELALADNQLVTELRITPQDGGVVTAQGQADLTELAQPQFQLTAQVADIPVDAYAATYGVTLPADTVVGTLSADLQAAGTLATQSAFAQWQLSESSLPGGGELTLTDRQLVADNTRLRVADGRVTANAVADLESGDWQAAATTAQVPIQQFVTQAEGLLTADVTAAGNLYDFDLATIQAGGNATIADAQVQLTATSAPLLERGDWRTAFAWQGDQIAVESFSAPGIQVDGTIGVDFSQAIPLGAIALNVTLREFDLQPLNSFAPAPVSEYAQLRGLTSFTGQLTGTLQTPQLEGQVRLEDLALNDLAFETLTGPVALSLADGGTLNLQGQRDRVQLAVNDDPWPVSFEVRNQDFIATGDGQDRQLQVEIRQFPLAQVNVRPAVAYGFGAVSGLVNANLNIDLADSSNPVATGTVTVTQPSLSPVEAERLTAAFRFADQVATLDQGELQLADSRFLLTGQVALAPDIAYAGDLTIAEGHIEDLVAVLMAVDLDALRGLQASTSTGEAADVETMPVALPPGSFLTQLESFIAFTETLPDPTDHEAMLAIPPLESLSGEFSGGIRVAGDTLALADIRADFDLQGDRWQWGPYAPTNQFFIQGAVEENSVTLEPVMITAGETVINVAGSGNRQRLQGEVLVDDLPVELVQAIYPLPVSLEGDLDLVTTLGGSLLNPRVEGEVLVTNTRLNNEPIERVGGTFRYRSAQLDIDGEAAIAPNEAPITLTGRVPYALPFVTVQPATDQLMVKAVVPSDSFDFINALSDNQVRWEGGQGDIVVQAAGTLTQPIIQGQARFQDGILASDFLNAPVTNIDGTVQFDLTQVSIPQLQANLGEGGLTVAGQLPLLTSGRSLIAQTKQQSPPMGGLLVSLGAVPLDYDGVIQAVVDGQIMVTGAVLEPTIGGQLSIGEGQVKANDLLRRVGALDLPTLAEVEEINPYRAQYLGIDPLAPQPQEQPPGFVEKVTLDEFRVELSDRFVIAGQPFYNIAAAGGITINGPLPELRPDGTIALQSGWINLFSTQFRLDPNAANTATFSPEDGLNPYVDVVLTARIQETDTTRIPPSTGGFASSEISDNNVESVGNVEFIRVQAVAMGYASELQDSLALTSNPSRSQEELIALLGSSVAGGLAGASLTQFAGFLGAGSLAGFGNDLATTLGLQSFSVFPTTDTSTESTAGVGIGVEASFAIGNSIGINILEILNSGNPPQLGVQYRLSEQIQVRGSSNLTDTEMRLEYRTEF
ncbi:MAG: translocation/assembly module TamB domain-containing protein [Leptolyngbyaceae cyanobacterium]